MRTESSMADVTVSYGSPTAFLIDAVESMPDGVLVLSRPNAGSKGPRIIYTNRAFRDLCGYSEGELFGKSLNFLMGQSTEDSVLRRIILMIGRSHRLHTSLVIVTRENGPLLVTGSVSVIDHLGNKFDTAGKETIALCRCGASLHRPFCDGTHKTAGFQAPEVAPTAQPSV